MTLHHPMWKYTGLQNILAKAQHSYAGVCVFKSYQFKHPCQAITRYNWCLNVCLKC